MRCIFKLYFTILLLIASVLYGDAAVSFKPQPKPRFRIVGYMREGAVESGKALDFDLSRITHLNIAFINPDENGNFKPLKGLGAVIDKAHKSGVKVLASIGGGLAPAYYSWLLADYKRPALIANIVQMLQQGHWDGIDVDLEGERLDSNYEKFVTELSAATKPLHKLLTAAVATVYKTRYTNSVLARMDFINVMSYDKTGPWRPSNPGQHSPYSMAAEDINYWTDTLGIAKAKISLGLPFYGYGFGKSTPEDMNYRDIVKTYPGSENSDEVTTPGGGIIYYNGMPTIRRKTELALEKAGGVMIWQLMGDNSAEKSLLSVINSTIKQHK